MTEVVVPPFVSGSVSNRSAAAGAEIFESRSFPELGELIAAAASIDDDSEVPSPWVAGKSDSDVVFFGAIDSSPAHEQERIPTTRRRPTTLRRPKDRLTRPRLRSVVVDRTRVWRIFAFLGQRKSAGAAFIERQSVGCGSNVNSHSRKLARVNVCQRQRLDRRGLS